MKFLVTGITGFVGPNMVKLLLNKGHEVCAIFRSKDSFQRLKRFFTESEFNQIDFRNAELNSNELDQIIGEGFDGIFHFAAMAHPPTGFKDPVNTFKVNVMGSIRLINAVQKYSPKTIIQYCSTSEVYGNLCKENGILKENDLLIPNNPYGVSKASVDLFMQERMINGFIKGMVTRAFSHTGPMRGQNFSISSDAYQIAKMKIGKQEKILKVGNLKTKRAVMDVRDCCNAYYCLMMEPKAQGQVFNICDENIHEMQYYTDLLIDISGLDGIVQEIEPKFYRPIDIDIQIGDNTKINQMIDWNKMKRIPIKQTLEDLLNYWIKEMEG